MEQKKGSARRVQVRIPDGSQAWLCPLVQFSDDSVGFGDFDFPECEPQPEDVEYVVGAKDTMPGIAQVKYGNHELAFVIMLRNDFDSTSAVELDKGETIMLSPPDYVRRVYVERR